jgi:hypothetical protein
MHLIEKVSPPTSEVENPEAALLWVMRHLERVKDTIDHLYDVFDSLAIGPRAPPIDPEMVKAALGVIEYHLDGVMEQWWPAPTEKAAEISPSRGDFAGLLHHADGRLKTKGPPSMNTEGLR